MTIICSACKKPFEKKYKEQMYCDLSCKHIGHRKVPRPDKDTLLKDRETLSWKAVGRKYGVSDTAVRRWASNYGINTQDRVYA